MPIQIRVGSPVLTINQGGTFMVTDQRGEINPKSSHGVFAGDTRFVSVYQIYINGEKWDLLSSSAVSYYSERLVFTNSPVVTEDGDIRPKVLGLTVTRSVGEGIHEDLDLANYAQHPVTFNFEITLRSDFADIFEVKSQKLVRRGRVSTQWDNKKAELSNSYYNKDFKRQLI